jgi:methylenetetrahydrofolate reductase (NADPH)
VLDDGRNAVTWGVFPGQEIAQSTIIERESFLSWKVTCFCRLIIIALTNSAQEEAFAMWQDWASFYPPDSRERGALETAYRTRWLVSVVHHDFKDASGLWTFLDESK